MQRESWQRIAHPLSLLLRTGGMFLVLLFLWLIPSFMWQHIILATVALGVLFYSSVHLVPENTTKHWHARSIRGEELLAKNEVILSSKHLLWWRGAKLFEIFLSALFLVNTFEWRVWWLAVTAASFLVCGRLVQLWLAAQYSDGKLPGSAVH